MHFISKPDSVLTAHEITMKSNKQSILLLHVGHQAANPGTLGLICYRGFFLYILCSVFLLKISKLFQLLVLQLKVAANTHLTEHNILKYGTPAKRLRFICPLNWEKSTLIFTLNFTIQKSNRTRSIRTYTEKPDEMVHSLIWEARSGICNWLNYSDSTGFNFTAA